MSIIMGRGRFHVAVVAVVAILAALAGIGPGTAPAASASLPRLVAVRAAHHPGYDRIVFEFNRSRVPKASVSFVPTLIGDFSGLPVAVPGRAVIRVVFTGAQAHTDAGRPTADTDQAFALPNIMSLRSGGDFEGVITLGVGLAKRTSFHAHRLTNPGRLAVDVSTGFARTWRKVYFLDSVNFQTGIEPLVRPVLRQVPSATPATGLLDRLFAGPTRAEEARGLRVVTSEATGFSHVSVRDRVARLRLTPQCSSGGSTFTIANEIMPTLRQLPTVRWIKIYDEQGRTETPTGRSDSIPECLEP